ncbi:MAG: multiubiquitin domain-containing protein [Parafilimonas terrae]|nr:multiubiquitin domain-containing protein [Parafilimonas terrae]
MHNHAGHDHEGSPRDRDERHGGHRVAFAFDNLQFRDLVLSDPVPTGQQILAEAGYHPAEQYSLFAILPSGDFEDIRPHEEHDLRHRGIERFVAFRTGELFPFFIGEARVLWGRAHIAGADLYTLAKPGPDDGVFLDVPGGTDRLVDPAHPFDLSGPGVERFLVAPRPPVQTEIVVNARARTVPGNRVTFEQVLALAFPGQAQPNVVFTMTYRHAAATPSAGELAAGGAVDVKQGTTFNVTRTVQS